MVPNHYQRDGEHRIMDCAQRERELEILLPARGEEPALSERSESKGAAKRRMRGRARPRDYRFRMSSMAASARGSCFCPSQKIAFLRTALLRCELASSMSMGIP